MNLVADESVDKQIVDKLRARGHEVVFVAESAPGITDDSVLAKSRELDALLITADKDFGELVFRQRLLHSGILLVRLAGLPADLKAELVASAVDRHFDELKAGFGVLSERALRVRKL